MCTIVLIFITGINIIGISIIVDFLQIMKKMSSGRIVRLTSDGNIIF